MRLLLARVENGGDVGQALYDALQEGYRMGAAAEQQRQREGPYPEDETTDEIDLWQQHDGPQPTRPIPPSQRPTKPPTPRLPRGVPYADSSKTTPGTPIPPPPERRKR